MRHPNCSVADTRLLHGARLTAVPATRGAGLHPNREVWVRQPREAARSGFVPKNKHRPEAQKAFQAPPLGSLNQYGGLGSRRAGLCGQISRKITHRSCAAIVLTRSPFGYLEP
jgi:hypothetical protein